MFRKKILKYGYTLAAIIAVFYLIYSNLNMNYFEYFELKTYDLRYKIQNLFPSKERDFDVVIVGIDEKSLVEIGKWPWKRSLHAKLLDKLTEYGVKSIGFDVSFTENGMDKKVLDVKENLKKTIGESFYEGKLTEDLAVKLLTELNTIETDEDYIFAKAIKKSGVVNIGTYNIVDKGEKIDPDVLENLKYLENRYHTVGILEALKDEGRRGERKVTPFKVYKIIPPISVIGKFASGIAPFEIGYPDPDGVQRGVALVTEEEYKNRTYFPTLYLLTYLRAYNLNIEKNVELDISSGKVKIVDNKNKPIIEIPTNKNGYQRLYYYGQGQSFKYYPYTDVINGRIPKEKLKNKIILVGYTATAKGLYDLRSTPLEPNLPGVEIHATGIQNLIDKKFMTRAEILPNIIFLLIFNGLIATVLALKDIRIRTANILVGIIISFYIILNFVLFWEGKWFELFYPLITYFITYIVLSIRNYLAEELEKKYIRNLFGHYISPKLVEELIKNPEMIKLGGEKKELTCFFSDIAGFTTISEKMSPEELVSLLNNYLSKMSEIIINNNGTIDKYIGDAIMAIFGAPVHSTVHAKDACLSAIEYQKKLAQFRDESSIKIFARIGINTGEMIVGNMGCSIGTQNRFDYTVMGDEVNLASRLESINKYYGTYIMISENTHKLLNNEFTVRTLDFVKVKGKEKAVLIYELYGLNEDINEDIKSFIKKHELALDFYKNRNWEQSELIFEELYKKNNDKVAKIYLERIEYFKTSPPSEDWDYSYTFTTK